MAKTKRGVERTLRALSLLGLRDTLLTGHRAARRPTRVERTAPRCYGAPRLRACGFDAMSSRRRGAPARGPPGVGGESGARALSIETRFERHLFGRIFATLQKSETLVRASSRGVSRLRVRQRVDGARDIPRGVERRPGAVPREPHVHQRVQRRRRPPPAPRLAAAAAAAVEVIAEIAAVSMDSIVASSSSSSRPSEEGGEARSPDAPGGSRRRRGFPREPPRRRRRRRRRSASAAPAPAAPAPSAPSTPFRSRTPPASPARPSARTWASATTCSPARPRRSARRR